MSEMRWRCKRCCLICEGCYEIRGEDFDRQDEPVVEGYDEPEAESYYSDNDSVSDSDSGDDQIGLNKYNINNIIFILTLYI